MYEYAKGKYLYPCHVIKFVMSLSIIESLGIYSIFLMGNLEKVEWVVLKSGYSIRPYIWKIQCII